MKQYDESEKKGAKISEVAAEAVDLAEKGIKVIGDAGKVAIDFAGNQLQQAKDTLQKIGDKYDTAKTQKILERYKPMYPAIIDGSCPKIVRIVEKDEKLEMKEYEGSMGYIENIKDTDMATICVKNLSGNDPFTFYPNITESVYYAHPYKRNFYIEVTDYFKYIKEEKVAELQRIAQVLGAKHYIVTIYEESISKEKKKNKTGFKIGVAKDKAGAEINNERGLNEFERLGIVAENHYVGKEPERPELLFWGNNSNIEALIDQRLNRSNTLVSQTFKLEYHTSAEMKEKEAAKLDGVLKTLKFNISGSMVEEVKKN